jgi:hypothetical protein
MMASKDMEIFQKIKVNSIMAIALSSLCLMTPISSVALDQNPEALEMRRVSQQVMRD